MSSNVRNASYCLLYICIMDLVEHLNTYVSLLHLLFTFIHISFDLAVTKNSLSLMLHHAFRRITLIINQQMHLLKISH